MLYSPKHNLAFLHIHKTGGTSFRDFLHRAIPDVQEMPELPGPHYTISEVFAALQRRSEDPLKWTILTIVRNPLDHIVSLYHYWRSADITPDQEGLPHVLLARTLPFEDFVRTYLIEDEFATRLTIGGQVPENLVILRLEHIKRDADEFFNRRLNLGIAIDIPHLRSTPHDHWRTYVSPPLEAIIREAYAWCYELGLY